MRPKLVALALLPLLLLTVRGEAQTVDEGTITVVQPKPVLRRHRVMLTPRFGSTINEPLLRQFFVGGSLDVNLSERVAIGGSFAWYDFGGVIGGTTARYEDVISTTGTVPELPQLTFFAGGEVTLVPLYGKMVLFNRAIGFYDLQVRLGGGVVSSRDELLPAGTIAGGANIYFTRWLGVSTELRDVIWSEPLPSGNTLSQAITSSVGLTVFIPFNFRYSWERGQ